jgi:hypothetical protein
MRVVVRAVRQGCPKAPQGSTAARWKVRSRARERRHCRRLRVRWAEDGGWRSTGERAGTVCRSPLASSAHATCGPLQVLMGHTSTVVPSHHSFLPEHLEGGCGEGSSSGSGGRRGSRCGRSWIVVARQTLADTPGAGASVVTSCTRDSALHAGLGGAGALGRAAGSL